MSAVFEANADGLVGPTHNYAGLSFGNVASLKNRGLVSNPREAALQGLAKMRLLVDWGLPQMVLPPLARPRLDLLRRLGFTGSTEQMLNVAARSHPALLASVWSASSMWAANAATVTPGHEHETGHSQVTPANLVSTWHRSLETEDTARLLGMALPEQAGFRHHPPLPAVGYYADEGAANHTRFAPHPGLRGLHVFVHGRRADEAWDARRFPARQTLEANEALVRLHRLPADAVLHLRQSRKAIAAGVFHNDVIAVGQGALWLAHEAAYEDGRHALDAVAQHFRKRYGGELRVLRVTTRRLPVAEAVTSYLFNSQLVDRAPGRMALICAAECRESPRAWKLLTEWLEQGALQQVEVADLRQSMRNGGGPACLRLRLVLNEKQWSGIPEGLRLTGPRIDALEDWVKRHYRDRLLPDDLRDPRLVDEVAAALAELEQELGLPGLLPRI